MGALILQMEKEPFTDLLGTYYMDMIISKGGQQCHGEFHTPQEICRLIGRMLADGDSLPESGPVTICEPACGSGAMILALAEQYGPANIRRLRVTAIDINRMACDMCFINTTLWGIPTHVIHGNSLNLKFEASWRNIHWIAPFLLRHPRLGGCSRSRSVNAIRRASPLSRGNCRHQDGAGPADV
ncbi:N-6 DNA methylase (plasmid) [Termitidicoccus mucosus]|uniref:N-6 DNA methylase n=1 Tax=Termitidicoccus mucosus TaxID=1184151 RepID=UPI00318303D7